MNQETMKENLATENQRLREEVAALRQENATLREQLAATETTLKRAKDISPVIRPSLKRVMKLAAEACMELSRVTGGWLLKFGSLQRQFKKLSQIWELLCTGDWFLGDLFPPPSGEAKIPVFDVPPRQEWRGNSFAPAIAHVEAIRP